jgi:hypothetical protein
MRKLVVLAALVLAGTASAAPPAVLGDAVIPNPKRSIDDAAAYADNVQPGAGQMIRTQTQSLSSSGVDLGAPLYVIVVDPRVATPPVAVIFTETQPGAADATLKAIGMEVRRNGRQVIAAHPTILKGLPAQVLTEVVARPLPPRPLARVYVPRIYATYKKELAAAEKDLAKSPMGEQMAGAMKMVYAFFAGTELLQLDLELTPAAAHLYLDFLGKPGSVLAKIGAAAVPSEFKLVGPIASSPMFGAGRIDMTAMEGLWEGMATFSAQLMGADPKALAKSWRDYARLFSGETGYGMSFASPTDIRVRLVAQTKGPGALASWESSMTAIATGKKPWYKLDRTARGFTDGDVTADIITLTPTANAPLGAGTARIGIAAVVGEVLVAVQASSLDDAKAAMKELLGRVRKPTPIPPQAAALLDDAKKRREALAFFFDAGMFLGLTGKTMPAGAPPFAVGMQGVPNGVRARFSAPAATVKGLVSAK